MNATNSLDYVVIHVVGIEQSIARGWVPTRYVLLLTGPATGSVISLDRDGP